nr:hypothetical protein [Tanacetum cinerariifolium]
MIVLKLLICVIVIQLKAEMMKALKFIDRCFRDVCFESITTTTHNHHRHNAPPPPLVNTTTTITHHHYLHLSPTTGDCDGGGVVRVATAGDGCHDGGVGGLW